MRPWNVSTGNSLELHPLQWKIRSNHLKTWMVGKKKRSASFKPVVAGDTFAHRYRNIVFYATSRFGSPIPGQRCSALGGKKRCPKPNQNGIHSGWCSVSQTGQNCPVSAFLSCPTDTHTHTACVCVYISYIYIYTYMIIYVCVICVCVYIYIYYSIWLMILYVYPYQWVTDTRTWR